VWNPYHRLHARDIEQIGIARRDLVAFDDDIAVDVAGRLDEMDEDKLFLRVGQVLWMKGKREQSGFAMV